MSTPKKTKTEIDKTKQYNADTAVKLMLENASANFTESCDLDVIVKVPAKKANESIRGSIVFPNKFGEDVKVLVLTKGESVKDAEKAGADFVGLDDYIEKIQEGWLEVDVVVATPDVMSEVAKLGPVLGPRQLMPNPKTGTVTTDIASAVESYKAGKVDFKFDSQNTIKLKFADVSMKAEEIRKNLDVALENIFAEVRKLGQIPYVVDKVVVHTTMGPAIKLQYS